MKRDVKMLRNNNTTASTSSFVKTNEKITFKKYEKNRRALKKIYHLANTFAIYIMVLILFFITYIVSNY